MERLHQTLQRELLEPHGPFETLEALQTGLDAWRAEYNGDRPHQSLAMAFPASRFTATPGSSALALRVPAELGGADRAHPRPAQLAAPERAEPLVTPPAAVVRPAPGPHPAVEADRVVPPSGNLWIGGQQVWLG